MYYLYVIFKHGWGWFIFWIFYISAGKQKHHKPVKYVSYHVISFSTEIISFEGGKDQAKPGCSSSNHLD